MIRRTIISFLFGAGMMLAATGFSSLWVDIGWRGLINERHWMVAEIDFGNIRIGHARLMDHRVTPTGNRRRLGWFGEASFFAGSNPSNWRYGVLTLPLWAIVGLLFVYPGVAFARGPWRRRRRRKRNQCTECGYDRTGNASPVCPECGHEKAQDFHVPRSKIGGNDSSDRARLRT
jgi:hypothetical protein